MPPMTQEVSPYPYVLLIENDVFESVPGSNLHAMTMLVVVIAFYIQLLAAKHSSEAFPGANDRMPGKDFFTVRVNQLTRRRFMLQQ
jgi:hypothetical protein